MTDPVTKGSGRVLVVDDDEAIRKFCQRGLEVAGFTVETCSDGPEAVERSASGFDAIVSDIQMPGLDGLELLRRVRERDLDVPVILMTGDPSFATAVRAVEYGALRYFAKPFPLPELVQAVAGAVRLRGLAAAKREALELLGAEAKLVGDRAGLEATFARAIGSLWMAFQPIVSLPERRIFGYEALLRSTEPALPHPGAVLDAAERLKKIHELGRVVRARVAEAIVPAPAEVVFFVNLHAHDLLDADLISPEAPLSRCASRVVLEITERASLADVKDVRERMTKLRTLGYRLAVDDLGAGYAGLTSFANIQPEVVKIDMSLVRGIDTSPVKRKIVEKLAALSHELKILVVAEGIETTAERDALGDIGCDLLQGYLFAKPGKAFPIVEW
jgi:EAL domain-containing protein (putative c-di-GMP-specific phosphodiesterase class I)/ActR/RegA family two-component response regulator